MSDILTLTMNPALDVLTSIDHVSHTHKMRCGPTLKHPGGGGVNVARVLHRLGANCMAMYLAGGVTGERHHKLTSAEKVRCHVMPIAEETRESFRCTKHRAVTTFALCCLVLRSQPPKWRPALTTWPNTYPNNSWSSAVDWHPVCPRTFMHA